MSGGSSAQSSSFNSNSMASVGPFGYASSTNQAAATNSYSNTYGGLFQKDAEAKKPTNVSFSHILQKKICNPSSESPYSTYFQQNQVS